MLIVKLGGSTLQDDTQKLNYNIPKIIEKFETVNDSVAITVGGGKLCRMYQEGLRQNGVQEKYALHDLGKEVCNFQAEYLRWIFPADRTYPTVVKGDIVPRAHFYQNSYKYFICGAWSPGKSSDYNAALIAKEFGCTTLLRISNIDYVYDDDPRTNPNAKKCENLTWDQYLEIIDNITEHQPGASYPVDPLAARFAKQHGITFYFTSFEKFLKLETVDINNFDGTIIS